MYNMYVLRKAIIFFKDNISSQVVYVCSCKTFYLDAQIAQLMSSTKWLCIVSFLARQTNFFHRLPVNSCVLFYLLKCFVIFLTFCVKKMRNLSSRSCTNISFHICVKKTRYSLQHLRSRPKNFPWQGHLLSSLVCPTAPIQRQNPTYCIKY